MSDPLDALVDTTAATIASSSRAFTRRNLFFAVRRAARERGMSMESDIDVFCAKYVEPRLRDRIVPGLLVATGTPKSDAIVPREFDAYFPAAILLVDRPEVVQLFAASGVVVQARLAVVSLDGFPSHVTAWLCRGLRAGHRAPIAYLHDAATVVYPFSFEPLATWIAAADDEPLRYLDLGIQPGGLATGTPVAQGEPLLELEELSPRALVAWATRAVLGLVPPDPMLAPLVSATPETAPEGSTS